MKPLEKKQQQQRGSLESGALRSHELGPTEVDAAWLFMRAKVEAAWVRRSRSPGTVERAGLASRGLPWLKKNRRPWREMLKPSLAAPLLYR